MLISPLPPLPLPSLLLLLLLFRNDTLAGRVGRRGDRVGGPYYMHRDDLSRLAPQWYNWTKIMRTDMEVGVLCCYIVMLS
jgi:hypothetical protein